MKATSLDFWRGLSLRALRPFILAVFATFAGIGFLVDVSSRAPFRTPMVR